LPKKNNISDKSQDEKSIQSAIIQTITFSFEERWSENDVKKIIFYLPVS
jgi:hypothetical protein